VVLSLLWTAWTLLPAIAAERPRLAGTGEAASVWLGGALTAGFGALRLSGELLRWLFVVLAAVGILTALGVIDDEPPAYALLASIATGLGAVATLALTASRGPFRFLALGFRSALDVALDVTNWLRVHPRDRNPRARITARYIALLRHLCQWTDPVSGAKYDRIVIVAHSQGTVISVEVLRFLLREHRAMERAAPELARLRGGPEPLPIDLFTVGCPLRQLYARRFPDLYGWAWHDDAAWPGARPAAASLGVARWMNAYRSGDYVGRYLWHPDSGNVPWARNVASADIREEFCAGPGAHTHYWDQPRPDPIGAALDRLIAR
jgi:hypothetical protein